MFGQINAALMSRKTCLKKTNIKTLYYSTSVYIKRFDKNLCHDSSSKDFVAILHHHVDELAVGVKQIHSAVKGPYTVG